MSGFKDLTKGGWHPKGKEGSKESWRGDFKGINQVAGWMGKGKDTQTQQARDHQSTPLSSLKDPASFGPPPKNVNYHGGQSASPSSSSSVNGGLGAALPQSTIQARQERERAAEEEANKPKPPPVPYRVNTTGLATANLPKPPVRRSDNAESPTVSSPASKSKPALPPRLPPRQNSHPDMYSSDPPPPYNESVQQAPPAGTLPQAALGRLSQAGVSVPGLNIGRTGSPPVPLRTLQTSPTSSSPVSTGGHAGQLSELQSRFSKVSLPSTKAAEPTGGTTWAQKQAALKTASALRNDPSSVSLSDAQSAASTANNFRERHGEQVGAGMRTAGALNQKYGVLNKVNTSFASGGSSSPASAGGARMGSSSGNPAAAGKKPPPPPPPKKKELTESSEPPPPIPLNSKPRN